MNNYIFYKNKKIKINCITDLINFCIKNKIAFNYIEVVDWGACTNWIVAKVPDTRSKDKLKYITMLIKKQDLKYYKKMAKEIKEGKHHKSDFILNKFLLTFKK